MKKGNAFWREVVDHLPNLVLLFRIDEDENAHLIFCSNKIKDQLGYTAKEYVLASETDRHVQNQLSELINEVAQRSHDVDDIEPAPCTLTAKSGKVRQFDFNFNLFKTKGGNTQLIAVELLPKVQGGQTIQTPSPETHKHLKTDTELFVTASDIMQSIVEKARTAFSQTENILIRGEAGTGKRTLIQQMIREEKPSDVDLLQYDAKSGETLAALVNEDSASDADNIGWFVIYHLASMGADDQRTLKNFIRKRTQSNGTIRIIASTRSPLEDQVETGSFDAALFYNLSFYPILIPPIRHRPADIEEVSRRYLKRSARILKVPEPELDHQIVDKLVQKEWTANFPELFEVLRNSLLKSEPGKFELHLQEEKQSSLFPEQNIDPDAILPFDEMNKRYLERILQITAGKIYGDDGAAKVLDLKPTTLQSKLKKLGIK